MILKFYPTKGKEMFTDASEREAESINAPCEINRILFIFNNKKSQSLRR